MPDDRSGNPVVRLMPNAPVSDDTEFAFIDGRPFINADKHELVVDRHVAERDRLKEHLRTLAEEQGRLMAAYERACVERESLVTQLRRARRWLLAAQAQATGGRRSTIEGHIRELDETLRNG